MDIALDLDACMGPCFNIEDEVTNQFGLSSSGGVGSSWGRVFLLV